MVGEGLSPLLASGALPTQRPLRGAVLHWTPAAAAAAVKHWLQGQYQHAVSLHAELDWAESLRDDES